MPRDFKIECGICGRTHTLGHACPDCAPPNTFWAEVRSFVPHFKATPDRRFLAIATSVIPLGFYGYLAGGSAEPNAGHLALFAKIMLQLGLILLIAAGLLFLYHRAPRTLYVLVALIWMLTLPGLYLWSATP